MNLAALMEVVLRIGTLVLWVFLVRKRLPEIREARAEGGVRAYQQALLLAMIGAILVAHVVRGFVDLGLFEAWVGLAEGNMLSVLLFIIALGLYRAKPPTPTKPKRSPR